MEAFKNFSDNFIAFFTEKLPQQYFAYILELIMFAAVFYFIFKVLKKNKAEKLIIAGVCCVVLGFFVFSIAGVSSQIITVLLVMSILVVCTMYSTELKRIFLGGSLKRRKGEHLDVSGIDLIIEEIVQAVQNMSKKNVGALIVLSNDNLPEGIVESGTVVNAEITSQMIEAVFYPKAPLHDGAMIIEGNKIYAAGCFLPLAQNEKLPKDMGSRHRAALSVTVEANVTTIVVSEETGIISIARNGVIKKKYADSADLKNALSDYYWSDLTAEGKK